MPAKIVLTSVGSLGDLHPFIALAQQLKAHGFEPLIAASSGYRAKVEAEGLSFHAVTPSPEELLADTGLTEGDVTRHVMRSSTTFLIKNSVTPYAERSYADLLDAMRDADLVVASSFSIVARVAAEKRRLPVVSLLLSPIAFFSSEQPPHLMELPWFPAFRRTFGARAAKFVLDLGRAQSRRQTKAILELRRRAGVPTPSGDEVLDGPLRADWIAAAYSPLLGPLPPDAPPNSAIVGFTFYDSESGGAGGLPSNLAQFLDEGAPPLVFSLGSFGVHAAGSFYESAATAARTLGMRAVLLVGSDAVSTHAHLGSDDVAIAGYAPHSMVFPRAAAIVHHGGIGTVAQVMRAGKPQLICPMLGDQADNAERLKRLGIARRLDHMRFTPDTATHAIASLLKDGEASRLAAKYASEVANEDGARLATEGIARLLDHVRRERSGR
ncbi:UDP:flavonoid glycosyltransferase YjiC (YdhE family) [Phenylobacterium haematophilum]|uniref:UDP:flavonoid glycosyltransferase YjiC (YdhE family) n=1 Tax=Phenylobacterium haematophilum TaxID=98513 RepID=A0A839ZWY3_9CAUL|nr:glycosyltransferase [Phenylobacterium haematophilum]MBB3890554.1 UDP:flavonoid glycosyltransferase YjiC (YdhE family) [Phenylobacterium haematophilum]